jgi:hypothetical protein
MSQVQRDAGPVILLMIAVPDASAATDLDPFGHLRLVGDKSPLARYSVEWPPTR